LNTDDVIRPVDKAGPDNFLFPGKKGSGTVSQPDFICSGILSLTTQQQLTCYGLMGPCGHYFK